MKSLPHITGFYPYLLKFLICMNPVPALIILLAGELLAQQPESINDIIHSIFPAGSSRPCTIHIDDELLPIPSLSKTRWDKKIITAWIKDAGGCRAVTVRKGKGYWHFDVNSRKIKDDSVFIEGEHFRFSDRLERTGSFSGVMNRRGNTLLSNDWDDYEEFGALDSCSNARLRFTGKIVAAEAICLRTDTIIYHSSAGKVDTCYHCPGIHIVPRAHDIGYGSIGKRKILHEGGRDSVECNLEETRKAINAINEKLRGKWFVMPSVSNGVVLFATRCGCECDSASTPFPGQ